MKRDVEIELDALHKSQYDTDFFDGFNSIKYTAIVNEQKTKMSSSQRKRLVQEISIANFLVNKQAKKSRSFLEIFTQSLSVEESYFILRMVNGSSIQVLSLNNSNFDQYLSQYYRDNMYIQTITKKSFTLNKYDVKYFYILLGFKQDPILGQKFDAITDPIVPLTYPVICPDLYKVRKDPFIMTHGPLDETDDQTVDEIRDIVINIVD